MSSKYPHHLAKLFSPSKLRAVSHGATEVVQDTFSLAGYGAELGSCRTFGDAFCAAYEVLCSEYRAEYVFKNEIALRLLIERHSPEEAVLLNEFRVGAAKADALILNGTSTAYEIKTDLDNLERLPGQLHAYTQVFDLVYVVTSEQGVGAVRETVPRHIGIMSLLPDLTLICVRDALSGRCSVAPARVMEVMRKAEYAGVVREVFGFVPDVPNGLFFQECQRLFETLPSETAHNLMVGALRSRTLSTGKWDAVRDLPSALKVAGLTYAMSDAEVFMLGHLCASPLSKC